MKLTLDFGEDYEFFMGRGHEAHTCKSFSFPEGLDAILEQSWIEVKTMILNGLVITKKRHPIYALSDNRVVGILEITGNSKGIKVKCRKMYSQ